LIRVRLEAGKKLPAPQFCAEVGLTTGAQLGA